MDLEPCRRLWPAIVALALLSVAIPGWAQHQATCLDARQAEYVWQADEGTFVVHASGARRYRIDTAEACPGIASEPGLQLVGRNGRLCGETVERIRSAGRQCAVARVSMLDGAAYAELARRARDIASAERVTVTGTRRRGFRGTTDFCVAHRALRAWHEDGEGIVLEVSPRRAGGNRWYRLELAGHCPGLEGASDLKLVSGMDLGYVCGYPGDHVLIGRSATRSVPGVAPTGCGIARVFPVEGER